MRSDEHAERLRLARAVSDVVEVGPSGDRSVFGPLALEIFAYQYRCNSLYREFCDGKGITPESVSDWPEIPAFPTEAFKGNLVSSFPLEEAVMGQLTSGSTSENRGKIFRDELGREMVLLANRVMTGYWLFPDLNSGQRCRLFLLAPSPDMAPSMGMAIGMEETRKAFGTQDSIFVLGLTGIDVPVLVEGLRSAEDAGTPVALIGSTSAFVYFLNAARKRHIEFSLPAGSRLCDGGGYRGRFGEMTREQYYELVEETLGVSADYCVNTLGMAESATNYFDDRLRGAVSGSVGGEGDLGRRKIPPPWTRVSAHSIDDLSPLPPGEIGLLRHYDLVNLPTVLGIQTDNLGMTLGDGSFEIIGRAKVVDGRVVPLPSERTVGPMGDRGVLRMLERYVNFSIAFKMGRVTGRPVEAEAGRGGTAPQSATDIASPACACQDLQEELVARTEDGDA